MCFTASSAWSVPPPCLCLELSSRDCWLLVICSQSPGWWWVMGWSLGRSVALTGSGTGVAATKPNLWLVLWVFAGSLVSGVPAQPFNWSQLTSGLVRGCLHGIKPISAVQVQQPKGGGNKMWRKLDIYWQFPLFQASRSCSLPATPPDYWLSLVARWADRHVWAAGGSAVQVQQPKGLQKLLTTSEIPTLSTLSETCCLLASIFVQ